MGLALGSVEKTSGMHSTPGEGSQLGWNRMQISLYLWFTVVFKSLPIHVVVCIATVGWGRRWCKEAERPRHHKLSSLSSPPLHFPKSKLSWQSWNPPFNSCWPPLWQINTWKVRGGGRLFYDNTVSSFHPSFHIFFGIFQHLPIT